jgi:hypothetical protein
VLSYHKRRKKDRGKGKTEKKRLPDRTEIDSGRIRLYADADPDERTP